MRSYRKVVYIFKHTGSVADVKTPLRALIRRSDQKIVAVRESVIRYPGTSFHHCTKELNLSKITSHQLLIECLPLQAYGIQLAQKFNLDDLLRRCTFLNCLQKQKQANGDFFKNCFSHEAHYHLSGLVNKHNCMSSGNLKKNVETTFCRACFANPIIRPFSSNIRLSILFQ